MLLKGCETSLELVSLFLVLRVCGFWISSPEIRLKLQDRVPREESQDVGSVQVVVNSQIMAKCRLSLRNEVDSHVEMSKLKDFFVMVFLTSINALNGHVVVHKVPENSVITRNKESHRRLILLLGLLAYKLQQEIGRGPVAVDNGIMPLTLLFNLTLFLYLEFL